MTLTVGSLFSGIGGLDLGLERAGMKVIWQSEIDPYCNKVLKKHWPEVTNHGNIKDINWGDVKRPDVICGGYPCQPFSTAGKRKGTDDPRHLWPWVRDAISALRPKYAILENVRGHLSMGGLQVIGELAEIGYDAEWRVVSAAGMGAPHRRERIIIVAYPNSVGLERQRAEQQATGSSRSDENKNGVMAYSDSNQSANGRQCTDVPSQDRSWGDDGSGSGSNIRKVSVGSTRETSGNVANSSEQQFNGRRHQHSPGEIKKRKAIQKQIDRGGSNVADTNAREVGRRNGGNATDRSQVFGGGNNERGTQSYEGGQWWEVEPNVGRVADGIPFRVDRLRGLGNAVVPQVAEYIGRLVMAAHNNA